MENARSAPRARRGLALAALCTAALVISLDTTIVNVALPSLVRQLHASTTNLQWVVDAYSLVFAALILTAGSLGDRLGRKGTLIVGLVVFGAASLAGSAGSTVHELIAARAVMGLGAALIFPATLSLISNIFTERAERARAIGLWGATTGVGIVMGPIVGGWLLEQFWWGSVFLFMTPVAGVVAIGAALVVPPSRDPTAPPVDWAGLALSSAGMGALILTIIQAPDWGWGSSRTIAGFVISAAVLTGFLLMERRRRHPMLDVGLFRNARFTAASGSVTIAFFALSGFIFLVTQFLQFLKAYSPLTTGIRLLPVAGSVAAASLVGTRLAVRAGNKLVVTSGLIFLSGALLWISTSSSATRYLEIAGQMILLGTGMGLTSAPATEAIMGVVPKEKAGVGSAVNDATRLLGGTLGVAVIGSVSASLYASRLIATLPAGLPPAAIEAAKGSVGGAIITAQHLSQAGAGPVASQLRAAAVDGFLHSFAAGSLVACAVAAGGALVAWFFLPARPSAEAKAEMTTIVAGAGARDGVRPVPRARGVRLPTTLWRHAVNDSQRSEPAAPRFIMVTGASSGIGRAAAARLADAGHVVFGAARRAGALDALAVEHPRVRPLVLDVTDGASIDDARQQVGTGTAGHGLDVLVNVAGTLVLGPVEAVPEELIRAQFEVNVFGSLALTRAFLPAMRERGAGRIVNVSSIMGRFALPGSGLYSASKFAMEAYSDALRIELAPFGVRVVLVEPGVIDTPLYEVAASSLPGYGESLEPYRASWTAGFGFPKQLLDAAASADGIAATLAKAALERKPRARYRPGFRNRMNTRLLTTLPTRSADRIKSRIAGGERR